MPKFNSMKVLGVGTVYGIAQQDDQLDVGYSLGYTFGRMRVKQVRGTGFAGEKCLSAQVLHRVSFNAGRKVTAIPCQALVKLLFKKVRIRGSGGLDAGVRL